MQVESGNEWRLKMWIIVAFSVFGRGIKTAHKLIHKLFARLCTSYSHRPSGIGKKVSDRNTPTLLIFQIKIKKGHISLRHE